MRLLKIENIKVRYSTVAVTMFAILSFMHVNFVGRFMASELLALVGKEGVLDTIATVGFYSTLGFILNTFNTPLDNDIFNEMTNQPLNC